jgi:hypothetical protein
MSVRHIAAGAGVVVGVLSLAILTPGAASASPSIHGTEAASGGSGATSIYARTEGEPLGTSPYVLANSPEEAVKKLSSLESRKKSIQATVDSVDFGPCVLSPSNVYLRKSSNYGAVGTKPVTTCSQPVTSISHTTELVYNWYLLKEIATTISGGNNGASSYTQKNVEYTCVGDTSTTWSATTLGTIVFGGRTYYSRVYTNENELKCEAA